MPFRPRILSISQYQSPSESEQSQSQQSLATIRSIHWWRSSHRSPDSTTANQHRGGNRATKGLCCVCARVPMANFTEEARLRLHGREKAGPWVLGRVWVGSVDGRCWGFRSKESADAWIRSAVCGCHSLLPTVTVPAGGAFGSPEKPRVAVLGFSTLLPPSSSQSLSRPHR